MPYSIIGTIRSINDIILADKELRCRTPFVIVAKSGTDVYIHIMGIFDFLNFGYCDFFGI
jgi:hypothetical protein